MKAIAFGLACLLALATTASTAAPTSSASQDINLAAFANGALKESVSSEYGDSWQARWITDENPQTGWAAEKGATGPFDIVISFPERSEIHALEFDTASVDGDGGARGAKNIDVMVSDTSATAGFAPLTSVVLKPGMDKQHFNLAKPGVGRWIKLVVRSNNGDPDYTELMEFRAFGKQLTQTPLPTGLSGTYSTSVYGDFHLSQDGAQLSGCFEHDGGLIQGGLEAHLMRLAWQEHNSRGPAIMVLKRDGKSFEGWWAEDGSAEWNPTWDLKKISNNIGSCPNWNPKAASGNIVATQLAAEGHVRIYGINFDTDSDHLRADAKPAINELLEALKANPSWKVGIEGHTDGTGGATHNIDLSKRRAASVKAALVAAGIAADRMATSGFGQAKPVASNDTEIGRAQNRRVEIVKQ
jgi:outer membrane protein OmpA-like peptidoglycan-associated protein